MRSYTGAPPCSPAGAVAADLTTQPPLITRVYSTLQGVFSAPERIILQVVFSENVEVRACLILSLLLILFIIDIYPPPSIYPT